MHTGRLKIQLFSLITIFATYDDFVGRFTGALTEIKNK